MQHRFDRNRFRNEAFSNKIKVVSLFETDADLKEMRRPFKGKLFNETYQSALKHYIKGNWGRAKEKFESIESFVNFNDHPSKCLLSYMEEYKYRAPSGWKGYRILTEK